MNSAVVVAGVRTPIGRARKGSLADYRPDDLGALVTRAALDRVPALGPHLIDDLICGSGQPAGEAGYNLGRVISVLSGLPSVPGVTVNRYCASSLQAIRMAAHAIRAGEGSAFVCVGVETCSRYFNGVADDGPLNARFADFADTDLALPDVYISMGETAERVRILHDISRIEMDQFALMSHQRAIAAQSAGAFESELIPVTTADGSLIGFDDSPRADSSLDVLRGLPPAFRVDGQVTAGNSCPLSDGAAAVVIMSDALARSLGIEPLAKIVSTGVTAISPEIMGLGPIEASRQAMTRAGFRIDDIDLVEINEAFAAQVIPCARELDVSWDVLNVHGGAIALGHPFGMSGARIMLTLLNALRVRDRTIGLEAMCVGGGQGMALILERLS